MPNFGECSNIPQGQRKSEIAWISKLYNLSWDWKSLFEMHAIQQINQIKCWYLFSSLADFLSSDPYSNIWILIQISESIYKYLNPNTNVWNLSCVWGGFLSRMWCSDIVGRRYNCVHSWYLSFYINIIIWRENTLNHIFWGEIHRNVYWYLKKRP